MLAQAGVTHIYGDFGWQFPVEFLSSFPHAKILFFCNREVCVYFGICQEVSVQVSQDISLYACL